MLFLYYILPCDSTKPEEQLWVTESWRRRQESRDSSLEDGENSTQKTPRLAKSQRFIRKKNKHRLSTKQSDPNPPVVN